MTIRVQCPNADCGHVITVRDEFAGKRGKCPACGSAMMIPTVAIARDILSGRLTPPPARERPRSDEQLPAARETVLPFQTDELRFPASDSGEPLDFSAEPPLPALPATRRAREPPPSVPVPAPVPAPQSPLSALLASYSMAELATRTALVVGMAALLMLSFIPQIRWVYVSSPQGDGDTQQVQIFIGLGLSGGGPGLVLLVYSAVLALLALLCLVLLDLLPAEKTDPIIAAVGGAASGWGCTVLLWLLGFIWKAFTTAGTHGRASRTILPGFGPLLGLFAALAVIAVFGYLVVNRRRFAWLIVGAALGLLFGLLLLIFSARPWEPWYLPGSRDF